MFHWLKKKCQRQSVPLFHPEQLKKLEENDYMYHVYEEIRDTECYHNIYNTYKTKINDDCSVCKYGRLDDELPCVCQDQNHCSLNDPSVPKISISGLVATAGNQSRRKRNRNRPLPRIPSDIAPSSRMDVMEDLASDSSSGYDSDSFSPLDIGIDDDILDELDKTTPLKSPEGKDNSVVLNLKCGYFETYYDGTLETSTPRTSYALFTSAIIAQHIHTSCDTSEVNWSDETIYL